MEQNGEKKKRHTGLKILLTFILLLVAAAAGLGIYFYPKYRTAGYLAENLNLQKLEYTLEVTIDRGELDAKKKLLIDTLAEITGLSGGDLCQLTIRGSVDGDVIYARIYPKGRQEPLTELYLSDELDVVNGAMLYSVMRENFCGQNAMLDYLFPVWEEHKFMSLKQAEDMFGVDLSAFQGFRLPFRDEKLSRLKCFLLLMLMEREKTEAGESYTFEMDGLEAELWPGERTELRVGMEDPADVLEQMEEKLSMLKIRLPGEKLRILKSLSGSVFFGDGDSLKVPEDLVSQNMVDIVKGIRAVIKELSGK